MAIRLEKAFGSTAETWLKMQTAYNLAQARQHEEKIKVTRYVPDAPAWRRMPGGHHPIMPSGCWRRLDLCPTTSDLGDICWQRRRTAKR